MKSILVSNFVISLLVGGSLSQLWALINEISIVEHINLFAAKVPANWSSVSSFMKDLTEIATAEFEEFI